MRRVFHSSGRQGKQRRGPAEKLLSETARGGFFRREARTDIARLPSRSSVQLLLEGSNAFQRGRSLRKSRAARIEMFAGLYRRDDRGGARSKPGSLLAPYLVGRAPSHSSRFITDVRTASACARRSLFQ